MNFSLGLHKENAANHTHIEKSIAYKKPLYKKSRHPEETADKIIGHCSKTIGYIQKMISYMRDSPFLRLS